MLADLIVCDLGEIFIPNSNRIEGAGRGDASHFIALLSKSLGGLPGCDRNGHDNPSGSHQSQGPGSCQHSRSCCEPIVDQKDCPASSLDCRSVASVQQFLPLELLPLAGRNPINKFFCNLQIDNQILVERAYIPACERTDGKFFVPGHSQFADWENV